MQIVEQTSIHPRSMEPPTRKPRLLLVALVVLTLATGSLQYVVGARSSYLGFQGFSPAAFALGFGWFGCALLLGILRPEVLVYAMAFFTFFNAWRPLDIPIGSLQASQLLALLAVGIIAFRYLAQPKRSLKRVPLPLPILVLLAVVVISAFQTMLISSSFAQNIPLIREGRASPLIRAATAIMSLLFGMAGYVATSRLLVTTAHVLMAIKSWIAGAVITVLVGIYLFIGYYVPSLPKLPETLLGTNGSGLAMRDVAALAITRADGTVLRVASFSTEPRHLAYMLAPLICFLLVYMLLGAFRKRTSRLVAVVAVGIATIGFALTTSRSTYILAVVMAMIVVWVVRWRLLSSPRALIRATVLIGVGTAMMLAIFAGVSQRNPLQFIQLQIESLTRIDTFGSGAAITVDVVTVAWRMFLDYPLLGGGWGSYIYYTQAYGLEFALAPNPNNLFLLMLSETGLAGFLALLWIFWVGLRTAFAPLPVAVRHQRPLLQGVGAALLAAYACFMLWDTIQYTQIWMLLGLVQAARTTIEREA